MNFHQRFLKHLEETPTHKSEAVRREEAAAALQEHKDLTKRLAITLVDSGISIAEISAAMELVVNENAIKEQRELESNREYLSRVWQSVPKESGAEESGAEANGTQEIFDAEKNAERVALYERRIEALRAADRLRDLRYSPEEVSNAMEDVISGTQRGSDVPSVNPSDLSEADKFYRKEAIGLVKRLVDLDYTPKEVSNAMLGLHERAVERRSSPQRSPRSSGSWYGL